MSQAEFFNKFDWQFVKGMRHWLDYVYGLVYRGF